MTKNPFINAVMAMLYIVGVATFMNYMSTHVRGPSTVIAPIAAVSLFTLSAAVMGYIFCLTPLQLYLDGKKKTAVHLFLQTILFFGVATISILTLLLTGLVK